MEFIKFVRVLGLGAVLGASPIDSAAQTEVPRTGFQRLDKQGLDTLIHDLDMSIRTLDEGRAAADQRYRKEFLGLSDDDPKKLQMAEDLLQQLKEFEEDLPQSRQKKMVGDIVRIDKSVRGFTADKGGARSGWEKELSNPKNVTYVRWAQRIVRDVGELLKAYKPDELMDAFYVIEIKNASIAIESIKSDLSKKAKPPRQ